MVNTTQIEALHRTLVEERREAVETAAASGVLPPTSLMAYLAYLDSAAMAIEAVLEERANLAAAVAR